MTVLKKYRKTNRIFNKRISFLFTKKRIIKTCIVIAGPTAVGKTSLAIGIAEHFKTEIISADSRQCYKELNIGVAKPTQEELASVPHHFINKLSVTEDFSVADYETYSLTKLQDLFLSKDVVVVCGGTGLYIKALTIGLDKIPEVPVDIREAIRSRAKEEGIDWAKAIIAEADPAFAATESFLNTNRLLRALEVYETTGKTIGSFQSNSKAARDFKFIKICLDLPQEALHHRINKRVDAMLQDGLVEEARTLLPFKNYNALNTVGYKELFSYFDNEISLHDAELLIKLHTRQYAKRQKTWFRKEENMLFCKPDLSMIMKIIRENLSKT